MDVLSTPHVPCLALVLGSETSLTALHQSLSAFPRGVTYPQFRHILLSHLATMLASPTHHRLTTPTPPFAHAVVEARFHSLSSPALPHADASFAGDEAAAAIRAAAAAEPSRCVPAAPASPPTSSSQEGQSGTNREEARVRRVRTRQELAGLSAAPVDAMKQLFNRIDVGNAQRVTWENVLDYMVAEAGAGLMEARYRANKTKIYSFSRALRCSLTQHRSSPSPAAPIAPPASSPSQRRPLQEETQKSVKKLFYRRFYGDGQDTSARGPQAKTSNSLIKSSSTSAKQKPVRVEEDLSLIRVVDGLESHNTVFFVSSRNGPFLLYSKDTLERVFTAPPGMLGDAVPTAVAYLAHIDFFLCYSTDDRLLRGWSALLAQSIATVAVTPLLVEGFVRRMRTMPVSSPTYADYADSVFLGDSYGHVLHVTAPRGRGGGMEFVVQRTYSGLHSRHSGGLVDFCVYGGFLYSSGFDGRVVATSLTTGQSSEVGSVDHEHLHALVYVPARGGLVAATSSTRHLLWWEANSQSALPGVPFKHAGYGDHAAAIVAVEYVADSNYLASADCDGVVKIWEVDTQRCVQSFQSSRLTDDGVGGHGGSEEIVPGTTLTSQRRAQGGGAATTSHLTSSAGRDMMMLAHNGLHSLLSESSGTSHVGSAHCHSLSYCAATEELMCGFTNAVTCWGLHSNRNPFMYDEEEVCQDIVYDVRNQTFLLQSATRLSVWDSVHGVRLNLLDRTKVRSASHTTADIKSMCLDDLGSRVFVAGSDGNIYVYSTRAVATDATNDTEGSLHLWHTAAVAPSTTITTTSHSFPVEGSDATAPTTAPVVIEQMYFSSTLRTWLAITSCGTLLVLIETDDEQSGPPATVNISPFALRQMRVSEELGLVVIVDAQESVFLCDMEAWADAPVTCSLAPYGHIVDLTFLGAAPVLVTVHVGGVCRCWSCPPAVECFELLGMLHHPQLPPPVTALKGKVSSLDHTQRPSSAVVPSVHPPKTLSASMATVADLATCKSTRTPSATFSHSAVTSARPLTASLRYMCTVSTSRDTSRHLASATHGRCETDYAETTGVAGLGKTRLFASTAVPRRWANAPSDFAENTAASRGGGTAGTAGAAATLRARESLSPESLILNMEERAKALAGEAAELTSVSFDERSHRLFIGDAQGLVHIYRMCELLQYYRLPRCTYACRPAFSLFSEARVQQPSPTKNADDVDDDIREMVHGVTRAVITPTLVRSVEVHVRHRDRSVGRRRSHSFATAAAQLPALQQLCDQHTHEASGVVCVRWLASRGVLATSGNDHEVWLLSADGEKLGFLSAERLAPRPKTTILPTAVLMPPNKAHGTAGLLGESLLSGQPPGLEDALPLQRPFLLPPVEPLAEGESIDSFAVMKLKTPPAYCTHAVATRADFLFNQTSKGVLFQREENDASTTRLTGMSTAVAGGRHNNNINDCGRGACLDTPFPPAAPRRWASNAPQLSHTSRALVDFLAALNSTAGGQQEKKEKPKSTVAAPAGAARSDAPQSLASKPLSFPAPTKRVNRSPAQVRFSKSGKMVQSADVAEGGTARASPYCAADAVAAVNGSDRLSTAKANAAAADATSNAAAAAASLVVAKADEAPCGLQKQLLDPVHDVSCSDVSGITLASTMQDTGVNLLPFHFAEVPSQHGPPLRRQNISEARVNAARDTEVDAETSDACLWVTGVPLGHPPTRSCVLAPAQCSSAIPLRRQLFDLSTQMPPSSRCGRLALPSPLRPKAISGGVANSHGRVGQGENESSIPALMPAGAGRGMLLMQRAATASSARASGPASASAAAATARISPMLAYASSIQSDATLELYSRELRQRLRRPRRSHS
jgi:WD40 repeat protein